MNRTFFWLFGAPGTVLLATCCGNSKGIWSLRLLPGSSNVYSFFLDLVWFMSFLLQNQKEELRWKVQAVILTALTFNHHSVHLSPVASESWQRFIFLEVGANDHNLERDDLGPLLEDCRTCGRLNTLAGALWKSSQASPTAPSILDPSLGNSAPDCRASNRKEHQNRTNT